MKEVIQLLNDMQAAGTIEQYAIFGAMAQSRYTQPAVTLDVDVLVTVPGAARLDSLAGIYKFCGRRGYREEGEAVRVGDWPVQFVPVFNALTREAVEEAETTTFEGLRCRVVGPDYLGLIALSTGRAKDHDRILALMAAGKVSRERVESLAAQHGLADTWNRFARRFLDG